MANVSLGSNSAENEDYRFQIYFNGQEVFGGVFNNQGLHSIGTWPIPIMIPPATEVKISLQNIADTDSRAWSVHIVGEVYNL